jgi:hypothetical protein
MTEMYALLGEIFFEVLTSPEVFRSTTDYHYAEHKVVEARPRLQWLATELQKISLDLGFHVAFTNPATQMNQLRRAAEDHQARALVFGNGVHRDISWFNRLKRLTSKMPATAALSHSRHGSNCASGFRGVWASIRWLAPGVGAASWDRDPLPCAFSDWKCSTGR